MSLKLKQIVVSIENEPGRLLEVTESLGSAGINLRALNLVDTGAFGQLRLLVSDVVTARKILMEMQIPAYVNEVVAAEIEDKPGSLARQLKPLTEAGVTVIFMYAFILWFFDLAIMTRPLRFCRQMAPIYWMPKHLESLKQEIKQLYFE
jgi:hypothetical protein